jgi:hypothetical protein
MADNQSDLADAGVSSLFPQKPDAFDKTFVAACYAGVSALVRWGVVQPLVNGARLEAERGFGSTESLKWLFQNNKFFDKAVFNAYSTAAKNVTRAVTTQAFLSSEGESSAFRKTACTVTSSIIDLAITQCSARITTGSLKNTENKNGVDVFREMCKDGVGPGLKNLTKGGGAQTVFNMVSYYIFLEFYEKTQKELGDSDGKLSRGNAATGTIATSLAVAAMTSGMGHNTYAAQGEIRPPADKEIPRFLQKTFNVAREKLKNPNGQIFIDGLERYLKRHGLLRPLFGTPLTAAPIAIATAVGMMMLLEIDDKIEPPLVSKNGLGPFKEYLAEKNFPGKFGSGLEAINGMATALGETLQGVFSVRLKEPSGPQDSEKDGPSSSKPLTALEKDVSPPVMQPSVRPHNALASVFFGEKNLGRMHQNWTTQYEISRQNLSTAGNFFYK